MLMTHFFRQYLLYVTFEVLEPLWRAFQAKVQTAESLDEVRHKALCWETGSGDWRGIVQAVGVFAGS